MKSLRLTLGLALALVFAACNTVEYDDEWIKQGFADLEQRMTELETRVNSNIASLTEIVTALQQGDYILSYAPYIEDRTQVGWQLNFAKSGSIIIYFGKDGKDGADGTPGTPGTDGSPGKDGEDGQNGKDGRDGTDGHTPLISLRQDADGIWYWTLDGEWLLDEDGAKVKAVGTDGKDGKDGVDGKDGQDGLNGGRDGVDGKDGKDGVTPQLKIEEGYWFLSLDNGQTWSQVGKATGENGKDGRDGIDGKDGRDGVDGKDGVDGAPGKDGDSLFKSVTEDDNYVYLTLADNTVITIPKSSTLEVTFDPADNFSLPIGVPTDISYTVTSSLTPVKVQVVTSSDIRAKVTPANSNGLSGTISVVAHSAIDEYSQIVVIVDNGEKVFTQAFTSDNGGLVNDTTSGAINGYEWVDLGLPSHLKWATCNVGASQPEEYGDYFAWGETETKSNYTWSTYKLCNGDSNSLTKYNHKNSYGTVDNKTTLDLADDAARANWGGSWRTPTDDEWTELITYCTWTWRKQNGVNGRQVTGPNGLSIFLPAAGSRNDTNLGSAGSRGYYWSSSLVTDSPSFAWYVYFDSGDVDRSIFRRFYGYSVRPVSDEGVRVSVTSISLDQDVIILERGESVSLTATVVPANATQPAVIWSSSNPDVATVDYTGRVTAVAAGSATVTATTYDGGKTAVCRVTVSPSDGDDPGEGLGGNQYYGSGVVTAGEWNDIEKWGFWSNLLANQDWAMYATYWHFYPRNFVCVEVVGADEAPVSGVKVALIKDANTVWNAVSDNSGRAVLWASLYEDTITVDPADYLIEIAGNSYHNFEFTNLNSSEVKVNHYTVSSNNVQNAIDVAFIVDATGSMGDEIAFLNADLKDIIQMVGQQCTAQVRTGTVFYRDEGDDYVTKYSQFTADVNGTSQFIGKQQAEGGGDWPEAVHTALNVGVQSLGWNANAKGRVAFLFLDAPPHHEDDIIADCQNAIARYAQMGIKVIPVAVSGIDKSVEYLIRSFAMATNGTYVFITNGVGNEYIEATIGEYQVEKLRDIIARLIVSYVK